MVSIPFPLSSSPGAKPQEGAGRLVNAFAVKAADGARWPYQWRRAPGLATVVDISAQSNCRGLMEVGPVLLHVLENRIYSVALSGTTFTATDIGVLSGTEPVTIAANNKTPIPDIVAVTENGASNLFLSSAPTAFADADLPQPNSVSNHNGYLTFTIGDGRIFCTDLNSPSVSSSSFTTARGGLLRGVSFGDDFIAFGENFFEIYRDIGSTPFPFEFQSRVPRGVLGTYAVAGWERGGPNALLWAADDDTVVQYRGSAPPAPVSTDDVSRAIAATSDKTLLQADTYSAGGYSFWTLSDPGNWTWEFNLTTGKWHERESYQQDGWRVPRIARAFDRWIAGDRNSGDLYEIRTDTYMEGDDPLIWTVESGIIADFPARLGAPRADFDLTAAVGLNSEDENESNPQVEISWSDDGGYSFTDPVLRRALGSLGDSRRSVTVLRTGLVLSKGRRFRLSVSDPVHVTLMGGDMVAQKRAA